jgi:NAD(P)H-quinone oxidoreductase subunit 5
MFQNGTMECFEINGFTVLIWTLVTFFGAIISSYGKNYLKGFEYHSKFFTVVFRVYVFYHVVL